VEDAEYKKKEMTANPDDEEVSCATAD